MWPITPTSALMTGIDLQLKSGNPWHDNMTAHQPWIIYVLCHNPFTIEKRFLLSFSLSCSFPSFLPSLFSSFPFLYFWSVLIKLIQRNKTQRMERITVITPFNPYILFVSIKFLVLSSSFLSLLSSLFFQCTSDWMEDWVG